MPNLESLVQRFVLCVNHTDILTFQPRLTPTGEMVFHVRHVGLKNRYCFRNQLPDKPYKPYPYRVFDFVTPLPLFGIEF